MIGISPPPVEFDSLDGRLGKGVGDPEKAQQGEPRKTPPTPGYFLAHGGAWPVKVHSGA